MEVFVFAVFSLLLQLPLADGAAFTASGSCRSLVVCHGQRRLQSRRCGQHPFFLHAAVDNADSENKSPDDNEKLFSMLRSLLGDKDFGAGLDDLKRKEKRRLAVDLGRQFVTSIMNAAVDPIPNSYGMSVVRNVSKLETGKTRDIILRNITTKFWQECISAVNSEGVRIAAIGTPGIGKTTSTPWLIRMLLEKGQRVVYLIRTEDKSSWYYEFVPELQTNYSQVPRKVNVNIYPETLNADDIPSNKIANTYYIVDPGKSKDNCDPPTKFAAKVILVSSPDSRHWGESEFEKDRDDVFGEFRYFPTWSYEELLIARTILRPKMSEDQLHDRFRRFGGVPRNVFKLKINSLLRAQDRAVAALSAEIAKDIALGQMDAFDSFGKQTKSSLLAFRLADEDAGAFEMGESYIVSDLVVEKISVKYKSVVWSIMIDLGPNGGGGAMFEMITRQLMANENPPKNYDCRPCVGQKHAAYKNICQKTLGTGNGVILHVVHPIQAAIATANVVFHPISPTNKLFDFAYKDSAGHFHVFQATVGNTHTVNVDHIKDIEAKVGGAPNVSLYYLVPSVKFLSFVTNRVNPKEQGVLCDVYHVSIPDPNLEQSRTNDRGVDAETDSGETESGNKKSATFAEAVTETESQTTTTRGKKKSAAVAEPERKTKSRKTTAKGQKKSTTVAEADMETKSRTTTTRGHNKSATVAEADTETENTVTDAAVDEGGNVRAKRRNSAKISEAETSENELSTGKPGNELKGARKGKQSNTKAKKN